MLPRALLLALALCFGDAAALGVADYGPSVQSLAGAPAVPIPAWALMLLVLLVIGAAYFVLPRDEPVARRSRGGQRS
jgi:hypothetical protein